ncbi:MAG: hypothetical protein PHI58_00065 [Candidatus Omnitrophica bacterium]|nr:hypothetical protein [Candidatus Omnitrophota bacterium]
MTKRNNIKHFSCLLIMVMLFSGCAWQREIVMPTYNVSKTIPIRVGIVLGDSPESFNYGPNIVRDLKEMKVFKDVVFPYSKVESVNGILKIDVKGKWDWDWLAKNDKGFCPSRVGKHQVNIYLMKDSKNIVQYSLPLTTSLDAGIYPDATDIVYKADSLQQRKVAIEIAKHLDEDYSLISEAFGN